MAILQQHAVVGSGIAGLAVTYHLLRQSRISKKPIHIDLYDSYGIGTGGASEAAAGLVHPFSPSGAVLWMGNVAYKEAIDLINASKMYAKSSIFWRDMGFYRPASSNKQRQKFRKFVGQTFEQPGEVPVPTAIRFSASDEKALFGHFVSNEVDGKPNSDEVVGFYIEKATVINTVDYMNSLWNLCKATAEAEGSRVSLELSTVQSLEWLQKSKGYSSITVAAGAAVSQIEELKCSFQLDLCQGYTVEVESDMDPGPTTSMLGNPYVAFQQDYKAVIGATQRHGLSVEEAVQTYRPEYVSSVTLQPEAQIAASSLKQQAESKLGCLKDWKIRNIRSGVRALPTRTSEGAMPYAGRIDAQRSWWAISGLGSRGLVYHAWLGRIIAQAIWNNDESILPKQLTRWKN